ncbi:MAG: pantoate--beta-alanine ligase [Planctomycetales bacterium]|nr:pantoate--beta-alanine ligase [Planctomycetales bacterium]
MSSPKIISSIAEVQQAVRTAHASGKRIGFVPTMGALHEGHLSLVDASKAQCDFHIVSIFVNPTQFGEGEDLDRYPRTFDADVAGLADRDVDIVFAPTTEQMYPAGFSTFVEPPKVASSLEGEHRPVHFRGVATVVLKLFHAVPADIAFFGEKDFQQCLVIQHMVRDLNMSIAVQPCPIVRETDGLAMSSRNRYLSPADRVRALALSQTLDFVAGEFSSGNRNVSELETLMRTRLFDDVDSLDYAVVVNAETLEPFTDKINSAAVALIAASVGNTRLIDNRRLG